MGNVHGVNHRTTWTVTTHDWSRDLDLEHLAELRAQATAHGTGGRRHMILEVLAYANDEAESLGRIGAASVTLRADGAVTISDNGRGTDTRVDAAGCIIRKPVMATKDVRFFDAVDGPALPDGLPRRGMSTVSALSLLLLHENHRTEGAWSQMYRHGLPDGELVALAAGKPGTSVTFTPDTRVSGDAELDAGDLTAFPWLRIEILHAA